MKYTIQSLETWLLQNTDRIGNVERGFYRIRIGLRNVSRNICNEVWRDAKMRLMRNVMNDNRNESMMNGIDGDDDDDDDDGNSVVKV